MKCYLDSNVLVYFTDELSPEYDEAQKIVEFLNPENWKIFISPLTLDECLHSLQVIFRIAKIPSIEVSRLLDKALSSILELDNLEIINPPTDKFANARVVRLMEEYNLHPRDAYHFLIMQENGISHFATFDKDFKKVFAQKILKKI